MSFRPVSNRRPRCRRLPVFAFALATAAMLCAVAFPAHALAEESNVVAYSIDANSNRTDYTSVSDAVRAGYGSGNPTIVMTKDWNLSGTISVPDSKRLTIDMNGKTIKHSGKTVFEVNENAALTLTSSNIGELKYKGCDPEKKGSLDLTATTGGLVTEGAPENYYKLAAIDLHSNATLNLNAVTVAGSFGNTKGGGVGMDSNAKLNMSNGASIDHNIGSGVYAYGSGCEIALDNATIASNEGWFHGGGIYAAENHIKITLNNNSKIDGNFASAGGGIYFNKTFFKVLSDGTGIISNNHSTHSDRGSSKDAQSGGGIHADQKSGENDGLIENVTIKDNRSEYDGGGLELDQEWTIVRNCTITGNTCKYEGGGVYVCNDRDYIDNCTITGNACSVKSDGSTDGDYEGGGVYVWCDYDVNLSNKCIIKNNTRGKDSGNADDLFLRENAGATAKAYIKGNLSKGSYVGVRTGITGDRMIAKDFKHETNDCLFMDLDGYYASYGNDHNGDAWQRHVGKEYQLTVNGKSMGRYKYNADVTISGAGSDATRVFMRWVESQSTGLYPFSDYVGDGKTAEISFKMPQHDVVLTGEYVSRITKLSLAIPALKAGSPLPKSGTLTWTDPLTGKVRELADVTVVWTTGSGSSPATGTAAYYTSYTPHAAVAQDLDNGIAFSLGIGKGDVAITVGGSTVATTVAKVDAAGRLSLATAAIATGKPFVTSIKSAAVTVTEGITESKLRSLLPMRALVTTSAGTTVGIKTKRDEADLSKLLSGGNVVIPDGGSVEVEMPLVESRSVETSATDVLKVTVTVVERGNVEVAEPVVSPEEGTYSKKDNPANFDTGKFCISATCDTADAVVKWGVSQWDGADDSSATTASYEGSSARLAINDGGTRSFQVKVWAELPDGTKSAALVRHYIVDDTVAAVTHKVTVNYQDTAAEGKHASWNGASETCSAAEGERFTMVAPVREGYAFEKWVVAEGDERADAILTLASVTDDTSVTAVYNPVVSGLDICMEIPVADKPLVKNATQVKARIGDSEDYIDVTPYFAGDDGKAKIAWLPSDEKADHDTCYTASLVLDAAASGGVKYALSPAASVLINGNDVNGGAYVLERDGVSSVCVECPNTGPAEYESVKKLETVQLSYKEALAAKSSQDAGEGFSGWGLPFSATVVYECGEIEDYEISWASITALDDSATGEQVLTATGAISFSDRGYVSHEGDTETVTLKIKVAAPEKKDDGKKDGGRSDSGAGADRKGNGTETVTAATTTTTTSSDGGLAAAGDRTFLGLGALVALGLLAMAVGIVVKRRQR